jgi:hypothetical protein
MDYGKWLLKIVVVSVIASIVLSLIGWLYGVVEAMSAVWAPILGTVLAIVLFGMAMSFKPGKETLIEAIPILLIVSAVIGTIAILVPALPLAFVVEWSLIGLVLALASIFFAQVITAKFIK